MTEGIYRNHRVLTTILLALIAGQTTSCPEAVYSALVRAAAVENQQVNLAELSMGSVNTCTHVIATLFKLTERLKEAKKQPAPH